jgi:hypothetical protein
MPWAASAGPVPKSGAMRLLRDGACGKLAAPLRWGAVMQHRWTILVFALGLFMGGGAPLSLAQVDCYSECQENCFSPGLAGYDQTTCFAREQSCEQVCHGIKAPHGATGAIAYDAHKNAFGYAFDKNDDAGAKTTALGNCKQSGGNCAVVASYTNACAAVAAVEKKGVFAVGQSSTNAKAQNAAMAACSSKYGAGCQVEIWTCSLH